MSDLPIIIEKIDLGLIDGYHVWEVRRTDTGEVIGYDQISYEIIEGDES